MPENLAALKSQILFSLPSKSNKASSTNPPELLLPTAGPPWQGPGSRRRLWPGRRRRGENKWRNKVWIHQVQELIEESGSGVARWTQCNDTLIGLGEKTFV